MASKEFKTPVGRFSYVHNMFTPVAKKQDNGDPVLDKNGKPVVEQQCTLIFDSTVDRSAFEEAVKDAILEKFGEAGLAKAKNGLIRSPFLAGDGKEARNKKTGEINDGLGSDKWFVRVASRRDVPVRYRSATIPATFGPGDDQIKSGDYGFAVLHAYAWHNDKNGDGVSFGINYLQKTRAGESLGGSAADPETYYEKVEDAGPVPEKAKAAGAGSLFG